ncbi:hypothetical protein CALVIDRAFT_532498 [Calocera viscosa TUFC12733]|uniref:NADH-ubiquinone oxidoreductase 21 kDa subunit n=1 Tax=Calocera viscosa (strain TUFC12733) TaxID=1330018 RepID=A0A167SA56_CALVF|nr:hypothetical protein CALVIDRAFT_532498 [Calocera viscosa TUFC12733]
MADSPEEPVVERPEYPGRPGWKPTLSQPYPLIDADPYFWRVVRYMRPSDYLWAAGLTISGPAIIWHSNWMDNHSGIPTPRAVLRTPLRMAGLIGATAGFLFAYIQSSKRFWGWTENLREVNKDYAEMTKRLAAGKPLYGYSDLNDHMQGVAMRNSHYSQLKLAVFPWFNFANHKYHGVDPAIYGAGAQAIEGDSDLNKSEV